jgi:hypothetical protein
MGRIIPYMKWKNKKCLKPPTRYIIHENFTNQQTTAHHLVLEWNQENMVCSLYLATIKKAPGKYLITSDHWNQLD